MINFETENKDNYFIFNINPQIAPNLNRLSSNNKWILYDNDNLLPQRIINLNRLSPTHNSILEKKAKYTAGSNILFSNPQADEFAKTVDFFGGIHQLVYKMALDYYSFGGFSLQITWKMFQPVISTIVHQDWSQLRVGYNDKKNENYKYDQGVWISPFWEQYSRSKFTPVFYKYFKNDEWIKEEPVFLYYKKYSQGTQYYPLPSWFSCMKCVQEEIELINFIYQNTSNSFVPSGVLKLPAASKPENVNTMKKKIQEELSGTNNAGAIMTVFADGEKAVEWTPISSSFADKDVSNYINTTREYIIIGHSLPSPTIIGLPGGASLGGDGGTIEAAAKEFYNSLIDVQKIIITKLEELFALAGYPTTIIIEQNIPGMETETRPDQVTS